MLGLQPAVYGYGNFDIVFNFDIFISTSTYCIVLDRFSRISQLYTNTPTRTRRVLRSLLGGHADRVLIADWCLGSDAVTDHGGALQALRIGTLVRNPAARVRRGPRPNAGYMPRP